MSLSRIISLLPTEAWPEELADALWLASLKFFAPRSENVAPTAATEPAEHDIGGTEWSQDEDHQGNSHEDDAPQAFDKSLESPDFAGNEEETQSAELSVPGQPDSGIVTRAGIPMRVPGARALPGSRAIARSLRPLRRLVASQTQQVIDEEATAQNVAERHIWFPTLRPARSRWLEMALVLDESSSMSIWRDTLHELRLLLAQVGAFRDVRVWWLDTSSPERTTLRARPREPASAAGRAPGELLSPDGSRIVLIASDCVAPAWDSGAVAKLAAQWGRRQPVAILQLLPQELWRRTALDPACGVRYMYVGAKGPGIPNAQLVSRAWRPRTGKHDVARAGAAEPRNAGSWVDVAMPILTAEPDSLARWARLVRRGGAPTVPAVMLTATPTAPPKSPQTIANEQRSDPREAIIRFRSVSSAPAFRLAGLLAAAPLRLPVMRLVQHTLLPESRQVHLAEFFLSGLIRVSSRLEGIDPDLVDYEFLPGARELLLDASFAIDSVNVQRAVSRYLEGRFGHALDFDAILKDPDALESSAIGAALPPFARVSAEVLKRLGGRYAAVAARLAGESVEKALPLRPATPIDRPFFGRRILWVDNSYASIAGEVQQLRTLGADIEHVATTELALEKAGTGTYHAIISDVRRGADRLAGIELLDLFQGRNDFTPFALLTGRPTSAREQATRRHAITCSRNFGDILTALTEEFTGRPSLVQHSPPPHLPDQCEMRLGEILRELEAGDRVRAEETAPDGSIVDDALQRWRARWATLDERLSFAPKTPIEAAEDIFAAASDAEDCRFLTYAELTASRDLKERLTKAEQDRLEHALASYIPFSVPDTRSVPRRRSFASDARSWLVIPVTSNLASHTRWVVSFRSRLPYFFGVRHIQWLRMLAVSLPYLREAASPRASDGLRSDPIDLTMGLPLPLRIATLLRTGLRLEGLARARATFGSSAGLRACRELLERTEAVAHIKVVDLQSARLVLTRDAERQWLPTIWERKDSNPAELCAFRFAELAYNSVLCAAGLEMPMVPLECKKALRALTTYDRDMIEQLMLTEVTEHPRTTYEIVTDAMHNLGPLWPQGKSAPLPIARKPSTFVMVAGQANAEGLKEIAHALGRAIAAAGFGLITGAWRGIDEEVTRTFLERLRIWSVDPEQWLLQVTQHDRKPLLAQVGATVLTESSVQWLSVCFERARAAVLVGGGPGTTQVGRMALRTNTLLIPIEATGGAASNIYGEVLRSSEIGLHGSDLDAGSGNPFSVIANLPDTIRRFGYRRNPRGPEYDDIGPRSRFRRNLVTVSGLTDSEPVTACVLARPRAIVTRLPRVNAKLPRGGTRRLTDSSGDLHLSRELFRLRDEAGETVVLQLPRTLDAPGLECGFLPRYGRLTLLSAATASKTLREFTIPQMQIRPRSLDIGWPVVRSVKVVPLPVRQRPEGDWQGAPVFDELKQVRGLVTLDPADPDQFCMVSASDWYRRVLVHFAATQLLHGEAAQGTIRRPRPAAKRQSPAASAGKGGARSKAVKKTSSPAQNSVMERKGTYRRNRIPKRK